MFHAGFMPFLPKSPVKVEREEQSGVANGNSIVGAIEGDGAGLHDQLFTPATA